MINIIVVAGIRTHYIKLGALKYGFEKLEKEVRDKINLILINAGQHYSKNLSDIYIDFFDLKFDYSFQYVDLNPYAIQGKMLENLCLCYQEILKKYNKVDYVLVMGDVATTFIASYAAISLNSPLKVVHLEGGLVTSRNRPEEYYRLLTDSVSKYVFVSSKNDYNKIKDNKYIYSGDIMYEYVSQNKSKLVQSIIFAEHINGKKMELNLKQMQYVLVSIHHKENLNSKKTLNNIFLSLSTLNDKAIFITHPYVKKFIDLERIFVPDNIILVCSLNHFECISAIFYAKFIITDSGGIQREAYYLNKRCLVRNDKPYWESIVANGNNYCISDDINSIEDGIEWAEHNSDLKIEYNGDFGDGTSVEFIFKKLVELSNEE